MTDTKTDVFDEVAREIADRQWDRSITQEDVDFVVEILRRRFGEDMAILDWLDSITTTIGAKPFNKNAEHYIGLPGYHGITISMGRPSAQKPAEGTTPARDYLTRARQIYPDGNWERGKPWEAIPKVSGVEDRPRSQEVRENRGDDS